MSAPNGTSDGSSTRGDLEACEQELDAHIAAMLAQAGVPASAEQGAVWRAVAARDRQWKRVAVQRVSELLAMEPRPLPVVLASGEVVDPTDPDVCLYRQNGEVRAFRRSARVSQPTVELTDHEERAPFFSSWLNRLEQVIVERLEDPNSRLSQALSRNLLGRRR